MDNIYKEEFELKEIPYKDQELGVEITLYAKGIIEFSSCADEETRANTKGVLGGLVAIVVALMGETEAVGYGDVHKMPIYKLIKDTYFTEPYSSDPTLELKNIYFTEIHPVDEDYDKIIAAMKRKEQE